MHRHLQKQVTPVYLPRKIFSVLITVLLISLAFLKPVESRAESPTKTEIEAVFIYKFLNYIEWPELPEAEVINICTIGRSEMNKAIGIIDQKEHKGIKVKVLKSVSENDIGRCKVLFIGNVGKEQLNNIIKNNRDNPVLTVASQDGFIENGGIINFIFMDNRVSFEINQQNADRADLKISSRLLRLAKKVIKKEQ